jgi:hypothetical protein
MGINGTINAWTMDETGNLRMVRRDGEAVGFVHLTDEDGPRWRACFGLPGKSTGLRSMTGKGLRFRTADQAFGELVSRFEPF